MTRLWWVSFLLLLLLLCLSLFFPSSSAQQLSPSQTKTLLRLQGILEYPPAFHGWDNHTNPCSLPPSPSFSIACSGNRLTELSISGAAGARLSPSFSIDSLFTTLSRFPNLTALSLVSLGLWGALSPKVDRLRSLCLLNLSSNDISGPIPAEMSTMPSLRSLVLEGNKLNGTVPDMGFVQEVNLAGNRLGPAFPAFGDGAVTVVLRNNSFRSSIPAAIQRLGKLQNLDLSSNQFTGPVPAFLFSLPAIRRLDLSQNFLTGSLPASLSCAAGLGFVDVSGNRLVGSLPNCIGSNSTGMMVFDSGNCLSSGDLRYQHPSSYCNDGAFAALIPSDPAAKNGSLREEKKKNNKLGLVLGVVGGVVGGAVVLGLVLVVVVRKARRLEAEAGGGLLKSPAGKVSSVRASPRVPADARHVNLALRVGSLGLVPYRVFSMEELEEATDNFDPSNLIQRDSGSQMYKGWLRDGSIVIIRCLKLKQRYSAQSVTQFVNAISKLRHRHLVSTVGHCIDSDQENNSSNCVYLIFEHVSNGTLRSYLTDGGKHEMLKWPQRVAAVIGVVRGIQFLHGVTVPGISGNDLNIDNILLDEALTAKISNYNLPMVSTNKSNKGVSESPFAATEETDLVRNTIHSAEHGEKEDVYQLGLILLEIITGKPVVTRKELDAMKIQLEKSLTDDLGKVRELADPTIRGTFAYESLRTAVEIALNCVSNDLRQRPSIDDILWNLQYSVQVQNGWASHDSFHAVS